MFFAMCILSCSRSKEDLNPLDWKMRRKPLRRTSHTIDQILSELIEHPLFEKDKTILSICTSSTEPFIGDEVIESTITIMEWFVKKNIKIRFGLLRK